MMQVRAGCPVRILGSVFQRSPLIVQLHGQAYFVAQLRDDAMQQAEAQLARRGELSFEIAFLNERLAQGDRTLALFDSLPPGDRQRGSLAKVARDAFMT